MSGAQPFESFLLDLWNWLSSDAKTLKPPPPVGKRLWWIDHGPPGVQDESSLFLKFAIPSSFPDLAFSFQDVATNSRKPGEVSHRIPNSYI
jgi:hypothetical protein